MNAKKYFSESVGNVLFSVANYTLSIITLPIYLKEFGEEIWGVYLFALSLNAMFGRFNLGLKGALRRYIARFTANHDQDEIALAFRSTITIFSVLAIINFVIVFILSFSVAGILQLDTANQGLVESAKIALWVSSIYSFIFWLQILTQSILEGHQHFWIVNRNLLVSTIGLLSVYVAFIQFDLSFNQVILFTFISLSIPTLLNIYFIIRRKLLKGIRISWGLRKTDFKSEYFTLTADLLIVTLVTIVEVQLDKFVLGTIHGAAFITIYAIITKPMFFINLVSTRLFTALNTSFAKLHAKGDLEKAKQILKKATEISFLITIPLVGLFMVILAPFMHLWVGHKYDAFILWGYVGILTYSVMPAFWNQKKFYTNIGQSRFVRNLHFITAIVNFIVSIICTFWIGLGGVIIGTFVMNLLRCVGYNWKTIVHEKIPIKDILSNQSMGCLVYVLLSTTGIFYCYDHITLETFWSFIIWSCILGLIIFGYSGYYFFFRLKLLQKLFSKN